MKRLLSSMAAVLFVSVSSGNVHAAQKSFVWTEEYSTLSAGGTEVEFWTTAVTPDRKTRSSSDWDQKIELEYGITDRLNVALYQVYEQAADSHSLTYVGYNIELKYRIAEQNRLPVDILLYAEHEESTIEGGVNEGKIILAKEIGKVSIAYNQIYEKVDNEHQGDHGYAAGICYEIIPWLRAGIESKGSYTHGSYAAGPTLAWTGNRIWADIGAVFALNSKTNDREARLMLGVPF